MVMNKKHTPLPYHLINHTGIYSGKKGEKIIASTGKSTSMAETITERCANAEFIVRACNSHYELLAYAECEAAFYRYDNRRCSFEEAVLPVFFEHGFGQWLGEESKPDVQAANGFLYHLRYIAIAKAEGK